MLDVSPRKTQSVYPSFISPNDSIIHDMKKIGQLENIPENTLDEAIWMTIYTEIRLIFRKFRYVLIPNPDEGQKKSLRSLDLWGPFLMCLALGLILDSNTSHRSVGTNQFFVVLGTVFVGAVIVTFNTRVLGGKTSFLQNVSMLGYCVFPLFLACVILKALSIVKIHNRIVTLTLIVLSTFWSIIAARAYMSATIPEQKKFISMYPIFVFYIFIGSFAYFI